MDWSDISEAADNYDGGDDLSPEAYEQAAQIAILNGFEVIIRKPDQLLLDIDSDEAYDRYLNQVGGMISILDYQTDMWYSKSGKPHRHIIVQLRKEVTATEALVLQAILGSDPMREYLNLIRFHNGVAEPTRLFKPGR